MKKTLLLIFFLFLATANSIYSQECGDVFTDPAGASANYTNNMDYTVTIFPSNPGELVTVTFTAFNTEANWDALYVFDGNSIAAPQIASTNPAANVPGGLAGGYWGTVIPGPFTSTAIDGSLTFRFRSDNTGVRAGWVANITCEVPSSCPTPGGVNATAITSTTTNINWTQTGSPTSWEFEILPAGNPQTGNPSGPAYSGPLPLSITGLLPNTCYVVYVRALCSGTETSNWSHDYTFCTQAAPPVCGGQFVDNGGPSANYTDGSDVTTTICPPTTGDLVTVTFTSFDTETNFDALYVFNGNSIAAPQIASTNLAANVPGGLAGGYWGTTIPGPFTSTSADGCLTFRFRSDPSINRTGWISNVSCGPAPTCRTPSNLTASAITPYSATFNWTQPANPDTSVATHWEALVLPAGSPAPTGPGIPVPDASGMTWIATGLMPSTCFTFYVRAICSTTDHSAWTSVNFCTSIAPPACGGTFVDNGGPTANYTSASDNTYVICPTNPGEIVTVVFNTFDTEANWDALYVFDGNSISAPQIASTNPAANVPGGLAGGFWGTTIPGPFTSTSPDGCLTFRFRSDNTGNRAGWFASVNCVPDADKVVLVAFIDANSNGIKDTGELLFPNGNFIYQQNNNGTNINGYSPTGQFALYDANASNTYNFSYQIHPGYAPYYNSGTTTYSNISIAAGSGSQFLYFPITNTQHYSDVTISISPVYPARPGYNYINRITYRNYGTSTASGTITFTKPDAITTYTVSQTGTNPNATGFFYAFTNLQPNEGRTFIVTMTVPLVPVVTLNQLLTSTVSVTAPADDINPNNNSDSNSQIVVNSADPNDKMESRGKTIPFNTFAPDDYFLYTIRFQNNGTANAIDVRVEDVLNAKIDETSVLMVSASHNYTMKRIGNQLIWDFKNIYLTTATANETASRGYAQFKVKLKPGFQAGDIIPNNASIYFDSNPAIVTANFNSKFTVPLSVTDFDANSLVLYPNPATNLVQVDLINTNEQLKKVVFYDLLGKAVKSVDNIGTERLSVDVSDLSKGVYLVEISSETNIKITKKLIVQ
ncbi:DUF7619 domain-containing protein [Flavobacterium wongokense]|uniref:DUF7619 domain-containing protein n=1 Tax=Flavobacterium wongokense TaxID=2910674 RepID=UPI001F30A3E7|nr:T9SS type A sorting domain-containing protein [Flavobacterium sp. WG47]MCF6131089.1 T9SS type A sorting domain-containing protein [Flavobacterium sp. WG47]